MDKDGIATPGLAAVKENHMDSLKLLLEASANADQILHHCDPITFFAPPPSKDSETKNDYTNSPLELLLSFRANPNQVLPGGTSLLCAAINKGSSFYTSMLLDAEADPNL